MFYQVLVENKCTNEFSFYCFKTLSELKKDCRKFINVNFCKVYIRRIQHNTPLRWRWLHRISDSYYYLPRVSDFDNEFFNKKVEELNAQ